MLSEWNVAIAQADDRGYNVTVTRPSRSISIFKFNVIIALVVALIIALFIYTTIEDELAPKGQIVIHHNVQNGDKQGVWDTYIWNKLNDEKALRILTNTGDRIWMTGGWPLENCPSRCYISGIRKDQEELLSADVVMFTSTDPRSIGYKEDSFIRLLFHSNSETLNSRARSDMNLSGVIYDIVVTYHSPQDKIVSDLINKDINFDYIPFTFAYGKLEDYYKSIRPFKDRVGFEQFELTTVLMSTSMCDKSTYNKQNWIDDLELFGVFIDSFGPCGINSHKEESFNSCNAFEYVEKRICIQSYYKFTIVFENVIDDSYVSSRLYQALISGAIPIYIGANNVDEFLPTYNSQMKSIIKATDFKSVRELSDYIRKVSVNETLWNSYNEWRNQPPYYTFQWVLDNSINKEIIACKICQEAYKLRALGTGYVRKRRNDNSNKL